MPERGPLRDLLPAELALNNGGVPRPAPRQSGNNPGFLQRRPGQFARVHVPNSSDTSSKLWRRIAHIIGFIEFATGDLSWDWMIISHGFHQPRILERVWRKGGILFQKAPAQQSAHKRHT